MRKAHKDGALNEHETLCSYAIDEATKRHEPERTGKEDRSNKYEPVARSNEHGKG